MPVVSEIEKLGYCVSIFRGCCDIEHGYELEELNLNFPEIANGGGQPKIVSVFKSVVQFIKWYNTQDK
jgi:hypothetical protein